MSSRLCNAPALNCKMRNAESRNLKSNFEILLSAPPPLCFTAFTAMVVRSRCGRSKLPVDATCGLCVDFARPRALFLFADAANALRRCGGSEAVHRYRRNSGNGRPVVFRGNSPESSEVGRVSCETRWKLGESCKTARKFDES